MHSFRMSARIFVLALLTMGACVYAADKTSKLPASNDMHYDKVISTGCTLLAGLGLTCAPQSPTLRPMPNLVPFFVTPAIKLSSMTSVHASVQKSTGVPHALQPAADS